MENSYRFFENRDCKYFPCHELEGDFNCLFCYCPLNGVEGCPGDPNYITAKNGRVIKDCTGCTFPHRPENYDVVIEFLKNLNRKQPENVAGAKAGACEGATEKVLEVSEGPAEKTAEPEGPFEIERKYLIEYPDVNFLMSQEGAKKLSISQTYICTAEGTNLRLRKKECEGKTVYIKTFKKKITELKRIEIEDEITEEESKAILENAAENNGSIEKDRYCIPYAGHVMEIDVYPFWNDRAILEIELSDENEPAEIPDYINVREDVTEQECYKNSALAKNHLI